MVGTLSHFNLESLQRELTSSQTRLRNLIERNIDGILVVCPEGFIRFANPAVCALLGRPCDERFF